MKAEAAAKQKTNQTDHMDHNLVYFNETKPCCVGPANMDG